VNNEVSAEVYSSALKVGDQAEIFAIVMRDLQWKVHNSSEINLPAEVNVEWQAEHSRYEPASFAYRITAILTSKTTDVEVYSLTISHELYFKVPPELEISQSEFDAFGSTSVLQMVYPYIREWVSRLTSSGGLNTFIMPPLRLSTKQSDSEESIQIDE
jgi:preprotein translocase subunit SecB